jgi:hypothetical protein
MGQVAGNGQRRVEGASEMRHVGTMKDVVYVEIQVGSREQEVPG